LFFSDRGKVYSEKAYQIPDASRAAKGIPIVNVLSLDANERVTAAVAIPDFSAAEYCSMATRGGRVKRLNLGEFASVRPSGLIAITLEEKDELGWARLTSGSQEIVLVSEGGQALRISETAIRPTGRSAAGVTGIGLRKGDYLAGMEVVEPGGDLLVVTARGFGKRSPLSDYPAKGRATGGVATIDQKNLGKTGIITAVRVVQPADELTFMSAAGVVLRTRVNDVPQSGRATRGNVLIKLQEGDSLASVARIAAADLSKVGAAKAD
jgi:DNA gyrase subunit A